MLPIPNEKKDCTVVPAFLFPLFHLFIILLFLIMFLFLFIAPRRDPRALITRAIGPIQCPNLPGHTRPLNLSSHPLPSPLLTYLLPLHQLIRKSQVWLDDHVQSPCSDKAVRTWEREAETGHHFGNADGSRARDANAAVYKRCCSILFAAICWGKIC